MKTIIDELLPNNISDEAAYILSNFIMELATFIDDKYFEQTLRFMRAHKQNHYFPSPSNKPCEEPPF